MSEDPTISAQTALPAKNPLAPPLQHAFTAAAKFGCLTPLDKTTQGPLIASEINSAFLCIRFKSPSP